MLALVDQGNGDPCPFTPDPERSIPAKVNVGVGDGVMSRGGMEGTFTCVCPPVDLGCALKRGLGPLDGELNGSCAFEGVVWIRVCDVVGLGRGDLAIEGCGMGFEVLYLRSSIYVLPFPVRVPGLGVVDPAQSNLPVVEIDIANAVFSSSYPPLADTPLGYPPPLLEVMSYQVLCLKSSLLDVAEEIYQESS